MRKLIFYSAVLIGTYIATAYASGFGTDLVNGGTALSGVVKTFQGR